MSARIRQITFDCRDPHLLARFWSEVLGFIDDPHDPNLPGDAVTRIIDPARRAPDLYFEPVPEPKTVKNRVHLDLQPDDPRDVEVERVAALGGTVVADHRRDDGSGWVVMADPEGNELCIERSAAERGDPPARTDTGIRPMFPDQRTVGERTLLELMLEWYREGVLAKAEGVSQQVATATPLASSSSIAGLVKHLAMVDRSWFVDDFAGGEPADWYADVDWDADRDWEFHSALEEPFELQVERYRQCIEDARQAAAGRDLDETSQRNNRTEYSLRYVYLHLIEETARHLGHLDILRELLDGTTGD